MCLGIPWPSGAELALWSPPGSRQPPFPWFPKVLGFWERGWEHRKDGSCPSLPYTPLDPSPCRYLLGKLWPVPPWSRKSPQIPPKPGLSHPGSLGVNCSHVTFGNYKGGSSWQILLHTACVPGDCKQGPCCLPLRRPFLGRQTAAVAAWATDVSARCRLRPSAAAAQPVSSLTPRVPGLLASLAPQVVVAEHTQTDPDTCAGCVHHTHTEPAGWGIP